MRSLGNQRFRVWEVSTRLPKVSSMLQEIGNSSYLGLFSIFGQKNRRLFEFQFGALRLGEDTGFSRKESSPR